MPPPPPPGPSEHRLAVSSPSSPMFPLLMKPFSLGVAFCSLSSLALVPVSPFAFTMRLFFCSCRCAVFLLHRNSCHYISLHNAVVAIVFLSSRGKCFASHCFTYLPPFLTFLIYSDRGCAGAASMSWLWGRWGPPAQRPPLIAAETSRSHTSVTVVSWSLLCSSEPSGAALPTGAPLVSLLQTGWRLDTSACPSHLGSEGHWPWHLPSASSLSPT